MAVDRTLTPAVLGPRGSTRPRRLVVLAIAAIAIVAAIGVVPSGVGAASTDPYGDELMRLTNLDRGALGKPSMTIDPTLASFARDLAWTCPTNPSMVLRGRAADMADRSYFSHSIAGCLTTGGTDMSVLDVMSQVLGYRTTRGENIAWNTYGTQATTYAYGCAIDGTNCAGTTTTPKTVQVAEQGFMQSQGHRDNILYVYDRFGCGSWVTGSEFYYACVFSLGGPAATPTPTPTPTATPTPTPAPTPTATPAPAPTVRPDTTAPTFVRFTGTSTVRAGSRRTIGTTVADNRRLARLEVRVDGRLTRTWLLAGTRATRSVVVASSRLRVGRHLVRWTVRDAAGHVRTRTYWLYVR